jgi:hypothetical protein
MSLIIELKYDPISKSITYKINDGEEKRFLDGPGNKSDFTDDLKEIIPNYADFMIVYNAYKNEHSFTGKLSSALSSVPSMSPNPMKWEIFNRSKKNTIVHPETSMQPNDETSMQPDTEVTGFNKDLAKYRAAKKVGYGGKKTKSRRSHNANKTLKNRK